MNDAIKQRLSEYLSDEFSRFLEYELMLALQSVEGDMPEVVEIAKHSSSYEIDGETVYVWKGRVILRVSKPAIKDGKLITGVDRVYQHDQKH